MSQSAVDAVLDLFLGSTCAGCDLPGRALCRGCQAALPVGGRLSMPTPAPPGLVPVYAAGAYAGLLRSLVVAHKERRRLALTKPLGRVLAAAVLAGLGETGGEEGPGVRLIAVPSARAVVRDRGHDPMLRMTRVAASVLRSRGVAARVAPGLRVVRRPSDQAGLSARERAANLDGVLAARRGVAGSDIPGSGAAGVVVLVDDVVTTGATLREAQRALTYAGVQVAFAATVAATSRTGGARRGVSVGDDHG